MTFVMLCFMYCALNAVVPLPNMCWTVSWAYHFSQGCVLCPCVL